jgi:hypothetical protein
VRSHRRTLSVCSVVETIDEAFAFVVNSMDAEGLDDPVIAIRPIWVYDDNQTGERQFECSVSGDLGATDNPLGKVEARP